MLQNPQFCAIIVSFNPEVEVLLSLLRELGRQSPFILVDNNSSNLKEFSPLVESMHGCRELMHLDANYGLASAMNKGLRKAQAAGADYIVFFDQDSAIEEGFVSALYESMQEAERLSPLPVAAVGARITNPLSRKAMPFKIFSAMFHRSDRHYPRSKNLYEADFLISSGCMISMAALQAIGDMKEDYFIDNIDLEWCFRAKAKGYELVGCDSAVLLHSIGEESDNALVKAGLITQHSPLRSYYSTRNRFHLYGQAHAPWGWKLRDFPRFILKTLYLLVTSSKRREYWQQIRRGQLDSKRFAS
ncbi:MAG: glycosyltransferase family 2 protein [Pseudohongiellaceae bacterium]|nr:glycosyltransferase family 2 protein [Pseudohongiellaceae bacterium]